MESYEFAVGKYAAVQVDWIEASDGAWDAACTDIVDWALQHNGRISTERGYRVAVFDTLADATLFKLRWG